MPFLSHITSTFFTTLINRLGVRPPPPDGFDLINTVQPVTIVDSDIVLSATVTPMLLDVPFTAGDVAAPGAGAVLADSGAQTAGRYQVYITHGSNNAGVASSAALIQRRNAANAANIWEARYTLNSPASVSPVSLLSESYYVQLQEQERIRVVNESAVALVTMKANIWLLRIL